ncbi:homoserine O-acetyltransferase [soil metagenome]
MQAQRQVFSLDELTTAAGQVIRNIKAGFETYGTLNADRSNAILICHHFSGNAHAAGRYSDADPLPGWWDCAIGPGKIFDTDKYFVIASDSLVNLYAMDGMTVTTGPASVNPATGEVFGPDFPLVSVTDFVRVQKRLLEYLGIDKLVAVAGPSGGSAQAIEWSVEFPECVPRVIAVISPGLVIHPYAAAMMDCWARPITVDAAWNGGRYDPSRQPITGLLESLRLTTLSALSYEALESQFGWAIAEEGKDPALSLVNEFKADAMLGAIAATRARAMDANHFLYMVRAYKLYNVVQRVARARAKYLFVPAQTDLIFPPHLSEAAAASLRAAGRSAEVVMLKGSGGHLDGLNQLGRVLPALQNFLASN